MAQRAPLSIDVLRLPCKCNATLLRVQPSSYVRSSGSSSSASPPSLPDLSCSAIAAWSPVGSCFASRAT